MLLYCSKCEDLFASDVCPVCGSKTYHIADMSKSCDRCINHMHCKIQRYDEKTGTYVYPLGCLGFSQKG